MSRWPVPTYEVSSIVSGSPDCDICKEPAERFVQVCWSLSHTSDHPVCAKHLQMYRVDFDSLAPELRRVAAQSRQESAE